MFKTVSGSDAGSVRRSLVPRRINLPPPVPLIVRSLIYYPLIVRRSLSRANLFSNSASRTTVRTPRY